MCVHSSVYTFTFVHTYFFINEFDALLLLLPLLLLPRYATHTQCPTVSSSSHTRARAHSTMAVFVRTCVL